MVASFLPHEPQQQRLLPQALQAWPFHPAKMVKVLIHGCATGAFSSRKLAAKLHEEVALRVLAAENYPAYRTLSDFRVLHLQELSALFVQVVRLALECGLVKLGTVAMDGTKLKANASRHKAMSYELRATSYERGRFWAGSMDFACEAPTGALYRYDPDGRCTRHSLGFAVTNGPTWALDAGRLQLYVNDTVNGTTYRGDCDPATGALSPLQPWNRMAPGDGVPDGMATDALGRVWIAHWGGACVSCHDPVTAEELGRVALPTGHVTNCCFGGPDLHTLFITTARFGLTPAQLAAEPLAGALFAVEVDSPGLPANLFGG